MKYQNLVCITKKIKKRITINSLTELLLILIYKTFLHVLIYFKIDKSFKFIYSEKIKNKE